MDDGDRVSSLDAARSAVRQFSARTRYQVEAVTELSFSEGAWSVAVTAVESRRVPQEFDLLATYRLRLDPSGRLIGLRRTETHPREADPMMRAPAAGPNAPGRGEQARRSASGNV